MRLAADLLDDVANSSSLYARIVSVRTFPSCPSFSASADMVSSSGAEIRA